MTDLAIKARGATAPITSLSGGNQQKVVIAKGLETGSRVLVLDNPTRGIDAGAKSEVYGIVRKLARSGLGVVLLSDELPEAIGLGDRVIVFKDGAMVSEHPAPPTAKPSEQEVLRASV
jgi:ABC-type sugar transport system ATPase subunit